MAASTILYCVPETRESGRNWSVAPNFCQPRSSPSSTAAREASNLISSKRLALLSARRIHTGTVCLFRSEGFLYSSSTATATSVVNIVSCKQNRQNTGGTMGEREREE